MVGMAVQFVTPFLQGFEETYALIFKGVQVHEEEGTLFLQNFGNQLPSNVVLYTRKKSSAMLYNCV